MMQLLAGAGPGQGQLFPEGSHGPEAQAVPARGLLRRLPGCSWSGPVIGEG